MPKCRPAGESLPEGDPAGKRYCQKPFLLNATLLAPKLPGGCPPWRSNRTLPNPNGGQLEEDVLLEASSRRAPKTEDGSGTRRPCKRTFIPEIALPKGGLAGRSCRWVVFPEADPAVGRTCRRAALSEGGLSDGWTCHFPALPEDTEQAHL